MEWLIIALLIITLGVFITLYLFNLKEIKGITEQLEYISKVKTNSKILLSSSNNQIRRLAQVINKSLEEKQKTEAEYKRMDKELRQTIGNMSHDLRTPLTSIMGYLHLIEDSNTPDNEKKQYIQIVKKRSESLQGLINSIYDISRLEASEYKFDLKPVSISDVLCDTIASFYRDFLDRKIEPIIEIDEKTPMVIADKNGVIRIISNLIQNMLRYGNYFVSISLKLVNGAVVTVFQNDAPNLTEEDVAHLFERFFTADQTRTGGSTGLGLSITKQLVEQMGHKISAELSKDKLSIIINWNL